MTQILLVLAILTGSLPAHADDSRFPGLEEAKGKVTEYESEYSVAPLPDSYLFFQDNLTQYLSAYCSKQTGLKKKIACYQTFMSRSAKYARALSEAGDKALKVIGDAETTIRGRCIQPGQDQDKCKILFLSSHIKFLQERNAIKALDEEIKNARRVRSLLSAAYNYFQDLGMLYRDCRKAMKTPSFRGEQPRFAKRDSNFLRNDSSTWVKEKAPSGEYTEQEVTFRYALKNGGTDSSTVEQIVDLALSHETFSQVSVVETGEDACGRVESWLEQVQSRSSTGG